jgi:CheY-like chemotaxis protein
MSQRAELLARIAHEINNPLTYVSANLTAALEELRAGTCGTAGLLEILEDAQEGAERLRLVVQELFSLEAREPFPPAAAAAEEARRLRVLLVDDEAAIRRMLRRMLEPAHDVIDAEHGRAALDQLRGGADVDVVVCDLMMPGMTGMELYAHLSAERPTVARRMIFMTGGAFTARSREFIATCDRPMLQKPIDRATLRRAIASVE